VVCENLAPPRLYPVPMSVKERWVGPREQVLNVPIAYWYMSPVSLVVCRQQRVVYPPPHYFNGCLRERNWVQTHGSVSHHVMDYVGSSFSREQWLCTSLLTTSWKVAIRGPREICMVEGHTWIEHGKCVTCWLSFSLQGVHRFKSPRLSNMSTACLWKSSRS
jgi:hypothetical protein